MPCARLQSPGRTDPFRVIGYPSTPDRSYMLNEQFTWLTPFSQQASPELTWCDRRNAETAVCVASRRPSNRSSSVRLRSSAPPCLAVASVRSESATRRTKMRTAAALTWTLAFAITASAQPYSARQNGDVVRLQDAKSQTAVSIVPSVGDIVFEMKVKGQNVLRWPYASIEEFKARPALSGIPFLGPWANRLDEPAFYANGRKYAFDMELGNVRGAIPIHGFLTTTSLWQVVEAKADAASAWLTSRLEFSRQPMWMKQWPFAHTIEISHRLRDGVLEVRTTITNMSSEPMPVAIGFHPYFQLPDSS